MNQKIILTFLIIFLITSFSWLIYSEKKQHQITNQWFLYFDNPQNNSLNFTIENYTNKSDFTWQLLNNDNSFDTGKIKVLKGDKKTVIIEQRSTDSSIIKVLHNKENRLIYK